MFNAKGLSLQTLGFMEFLQNNNHQGVNKMTSRTLANRIRTHDSHGFNKGRSSKFREGSRVRQTPEEGRRTYRPKRYGNIKKNEDISPKTF